MGRYQTLALLIFAVKVGDGCEFHGDDRWRYLIREPVKQEYYTKIIMFG